MQPQHAALLLCSLLANELPAAPIRQLVVFGDSHSDMGNACTHFHDDPDCVGLRYTNGPVWIEELAERLAVPPPLASVAGGLNFAFGGARTGFGNDSYQGTPIPKIGAQVAQFLEQQAPRDQQLLVIFAGHNDWNWNRVVSPTTVVENMSAHITALAAAGGRRFLVPNLSPLGHAPYLRGTFWGNRTNVAIAEYNQLLATELDDLELRLGVQIHHVDFAALTSHTIADPSSAGLTNVLDRADQSISGDPDEYLYWDSIHFTTAYHRILGGAAANAVIAEPASLSLVVLASIAYGFRRRRAASTAVAPRGSAWAACDARTSALQTNTARR